MLSLKEIKNLYPANIHKFDRGILREYLQYLILNIIYSYPIGRKLSFLGGTCLRIVYDSQRFSEDLDFDNKQLTSEEFLQLSKYIQKELEGLGLQVEINIVEKTAFHCKIKFRDILQLNNLSSAYTEKILIRVDTFDQGVNYKTDTYILNKFDITKPIIITPKEIILSQKLWTITQRERSKGRDFYDIVFLLQNTKPNKEFLFKKFNTKSMKDIKEKIMDYIENTDFEKLSNDVKPFLINNSESDKVLYFKEIFEQSSLE